MDERLLLPCNRTQELLDSIRDPLNTRKALESLALRMATNLAIECAFKNGTDVPIGAVALRGGEIIGTGSASDRQLRQKHLHAEAMALYDTFTKPDSDEPMTMVVSAEPCRSCQDFMADNGVSRIVFGLSRLDLVELDIVKPHGESIFDRTMRLGMPFDIEQLEDPYLRGIGLTVMESVWRDKQTEEVSINTLALAENLASYNFALL
jgi:tRNA(Arg) A34 adenosine deaminase TadA